MLAPFQNDELADPETRTGWPILSQILAEKFDNNDVTQKALNRLAINEHQLQSITQGKAVPSDELLALILYQAGIRDRHSIAQFMQAAKTARCELPTIDHTGQGYIPPIEKRKIKVVKKPRRKTADELKIDRKKTKAEWHKIEKVCTKDKPLFEGVNLHAYKKKIGITGGVLKRGIAKILRHIPQREWSSMVAIISKQAPLHSSIHISLSMIEAFREKKIVYDLIAPPEGWHTLSSLRDIFTDSSITMQRRIDEAVKILKKQGFHENEIVVVAHNKKRELVPFYRPLIEETLWKKMGVATQHDRVRVTKRPPSHLTITECRQLLGGDYNRIIGKIQSYLLTLPEEKREGLLIKSRGRGGIVTQFFQRGALTDMEEKGYFKDQANYRAQPDKPDSWQSSADLVKVYNGNKAKMIRIARAFKSAVEEHEGVEVTQRYVGHYKYKGKIGIFLHPKAVRMIEAGYHGLTFSRR